VITDIDDTIALSQVRPQGPLPSYLFNVVRRFFNDHDAFIGMPAVFNFLATNGAEFEYVTGTFDFLSHVPSAFLDSSGFPVGKISLRPSLSVATLDFKLSRISEIMSKAIRRHGRDARFILIGDNGQWDVEVYRRLASDPEFAPHIEIVYIHHLYNYRLGMPLASGQKGYMTTADLALDLTRRGLLSSEQLASIASLVAQGIKSRSSDVQERSFPDFALVPPEDLREFRMALLSVADPSTRRDLHFIGKHLAGRPRNATQPACEAIFR
jgi:hypothetical protein